MHGVLNSGTGSEGSAVRAVSEASSGSNRSSMSRRPGARRGVLNRCCYTVGDLVHQASQTLDAIAESVTVG